MPVLPAKLEAHSASSGATRVDPAPLSGVVVAATAPAVKPVDAPSDMPATARRTRVWRWKAKPFKMRTFRVGIGRSRGPADPTSSRSMGAPAISLVASPLPTFVDPVIDGRARIGDG